MSQELPQNLTNIYPDFTVELINNFIIYFKTREQKAKDFTLFDGTDTSDETSTNMAMEEFYSEMVKFKENERDNPLSTKILKYNEINNEITNSNELYCISKEGLPMYVSQSFFAILIELTNLKREYPDNKFNIINLK